MAEAPCVAAARNRKVARARLYANSPTVTPILSSEAYQQLLLAAAEGNHGAMPPHPSRRAPWRPPQDERRELTARFVAETVHQRFVLAAVNFDHGAVDHFHQRRRQHGHEVC